MSYGHYFCLQGKPNRDPKDEFTKPDGSLAKDADDFANSWLVKDSCKGKDTKDQLAHPLLTAEGVAKATELCSKIDSPAFASCKDEAERKADLNNCIMDVATCDR